MAESYECKRQIYLRPDETVKHGLVLVDDADSMTIEDMTTNCHNFILNVETSPTLTKVL